MKNTEIIWNNNNCAVIILLKQFECIWSWSLQANNNAASQKLLPHRLGIEMSAIYSGSLKVKNEKKNTKGQKPELVHKDSSYKFIKATNNSSRNNAVFSFLLEMHKERMHREKMRRGRFRPAGNQ